MSILTPYLVKRILQGYALPLRGAHGITHWARVLENGRRLAPMASADLVVVELFAIFHDSRRMNESIDHGHGRRGAELARALRGQAFELDDERFALLELACNEHTAGFTDADPTVQVCWDSDRLDLLRVGIRPSLGRLCTQTARSDVVLEWANARAAARVVPDLIQTEWGLDGAFPSKQGDQP